MRVAMGLGVLLSAWLLVAGCADEWAGLAERPKEEAAAALAGLDPARRFPVAFSYGEESARREGLAGAVARGALLPQELQHDFFDGAAHGWTAPADLDATAVQALLAESLPWQWRHLFEEATARSWTEQARGDPEVIVPQVVAWQAATHGPLPLDGVRVGLQRSRGADLRGAVRLAATYPPEWQAALYEELGWRAGNDWRWWSWRWSRLRDSVPEAERCAFVHGVSRGQVLREPWKDSAAANAAVDRATRLAPGCEEAAWQGVAWALYLTWGRDAGTVAAWVERPDVRASLERGIQRAGSPQRPTPWQMPG